MRAAITYVAVAIVLSAGTARAQVSKTLNGESKVVTATVEAIEKSTRKVTLKNTDGTYEVLDVPASAKRFDGLKVGDTVKARYYETVVFRLKEAGEKDVDSASAATTPTTGGMKPAGTMAGQRTITAKITAIDEKIPSISFTGPNGWAYSTRVEDKAALAKVKVGDRVDITWTAAALVSFE
jgi:Cu/Ag efflux protein CusF